MKILLVKTTSFGDVLHALPALTDARRHVDGLVCDWLVEAPYAPIPAWHPAVRTVIPVAMRGWRRPPWIQHLPALRRFVRQLRREQPNVSVAVFERETERTYKVGESTVEIAANYLVRRLGLSTYLYKEHLPKNGLRFFFDTEGHDAELTEMSEIGVHAFPPCPSFQVDRARLERDLLRMNADGVRMQHGSQQTHGRTPAYRPIPRAITPQTIQASGGQTL